LRTSCTCFWGTERNGKAGYHRSTPYGEAGLEGRDARCVLLRNLLYCTGGQLQCSSFYYPCVSVSYSSVHPFCPCMLLTLSHLISPHQTHAALLRRNDSGAWWVKALPYHLGFPGSGRPRVSYCNLDSGGARRRVDSAYISSLGVSGRELRVDTKG
jgi:hypothetical protein